MPQRKREGMWRLMKQSRPVLTFTGWVQIAQAALRGYTNRSESSRFINNAKPLRSRSRLLDAIAPALAD